MGKDIKEKYERVCAIKDKAISLVETQLNGDLSSVDAKELGEVADIAKDMAELMKLSEEACYYHKVTEAMDEGSDEEKKYYMNKYIPEYEGKFYTPIDYARRRDSRGRYMYTEPDWHMEPTSRDIDRMHYNTMDMTDGRTTNGMTTRSAITRRTYMDMANSDKTSKTEKLKEYLQNFSDEMTEMFVEGKASPEEKQIAKQTLMQFINKW